MDFSTYQHDDVVPGMRVLDLPFDARIFVLTRLGNSIHLGAANGMYHWEYRYHTGKCTHVWQIWPGASDYYERNGERVEPQVADHMIRSRFAVDDPALQLPEGM